MRQGSQDQSARVRTEQNSAKVVKPTRKKAKNYRDTVHWTIIINEIC